MTPGNAIERKAGHRGRPLALVVGHQMKIASCFIIAAALGGLLSPAVASPESLNDRVKRGEVSTMPSDSPAMAAAFAKAQATLDDFLRIAGHPPPGLASLALKVRVSEGQKREYFWVSPFRVEPDGFSGTLNNQPRLVQGVKQGQQLKFTRADVVDWMYYDTAKKRMHGNFTACAQLTRESPQDQASFKAKYGLECDG
jgi:uncharacterized protein YegJ (DUF2314 family)